MDWSKLTLQTEKGTQAVPCLDVVAFCSERPTQGVPGFERFMRTFTDRFVDKLTFYRTGDMKRFRPFERSALDAPSHWFSDAALLATKLLGFRAHSGKTQQENQPPAIDFVLGGLYDPPDLSFRVSLPVDAANDADALVQLVQEALAEFPLQSGYCGYSLLWEKTDLAGEPAICAWAAPLMLRHPGLNYGAVGMTANAVHSGVAAVSWLTFLGPGITNDLGGQDALRERCPDGVSLLPLPPGGCILRAGEAPALGDVNRGDRLPAYQAVGRLVAPRRADDDALKNAYVEGMTEEQSDAWLRRFFE